MSKTNFKGHIRFQGCVEHVPYLPTCPPCPPCPPSPFIYRHFSHDIPIWNITEKLCTNYGLRSVDYQHSPTPYLHSISTRTVIFPKSKAPIPLPSLSPSLANTFLMQCVRQKGNFKKWAAEYICHSYLHCTSRMYHTSLFGPEVFVRFLRLFNFRLRLASLT
jgi:hypothetical protein